MVFWPPVRRRQRLVDMAEAEQEGECELSGWLWINDVRGRSSGFNFVYLRPSEWNVWFIERSAYVRIHSCGLACKVLCGFGRTPDSPPVCALTRGCGKHVPCRAGSLTAGKCFGIQKECSSVCLMCIFVRFLCRYPCRTSRKKTRCSSSSERSSTRRMSAKSSYRRLPRYAAVVLDGI